MWILIGVLVFWILSSKPHRSATPQAHSYKGGIRDGKKINEFKRYLYRDLGTGILGCFGSHCVYHIDEYKLLWF
jgi:hypothetical protein